MPGRIEEEIIPGNNPSTSEQASNDSQPTRETQDPSPPSMPSNELANLLRMPATSPSTGSTTSASTENMNEGSSFTQTGSRNAETRPKAPKLKGVKVEIETVWFLEAFLALWSRLVGSIIYAIVTVSIER